ncbi:hypothetical protein HPB52_007935 [Rhipicephalus sanguineus]|uniref:Uncharacterized protein n=1 Tax=Rhipicephalus sanguineus TaxID=34632 RepID=A0A9D4PZS3_RHISA|nr:hypothetical protein HPB52_007935 [Rhipicephalus sanguineus]
MSDNSCPEKDALRDAWPSAKQLLCIFHVLQAEWRWLMSARSLEKEDRHNLIASFQKILYAKDAAELEAAKASLRSLPPASYIQRVEAFLHREHEWVLLYHAGVDIGAPSPPPGTSQPAAGGKASYSEPPNDAEDPPAGHSSQPEQMAARRVQYDARFKRSAILMAEEIGNSAAVRRLDVAESTIRGWRL